jgi:hypothetical protein
MKPLKLIALAAVVAALSACEGGGRFPTCKSDAECAARGSASAAPLCYELRCVACRSDDDCKPGEACNTANECKRFSEAPEAPPKDAGAVEKESWEPSTPADHDRCVAACRGDKECLKGCGGGKPAKKK